jgi:hypothetical protein
MGANCTASNSTLNAQSASMRHGMRSLRARNHMLSSRMCLFHRQLALGRMQREQPVNRGSLFVTLRQRGQARTRSRLGPRLMGIRGPDAGEGRGAHHGRLSRSPSPPSPSPPSQLRLRPLRAAPRHSSLAAALVQPGRRGGKGVERATPCAVGQV